MDALLLRVPASKCALTEPSQLQRGNTVPEKCHPGTAPAHTPQPANHNRMYEAAQRGAQQNQRMSTILMTEALPMRCKATMESPCGQRRWTSCVLSKGARKGEAVIALPRLRWAA